MSKMKIPIMMILLIAEIDEKNALTTFLNCGKLLITLNGLKALSALKALRAEKDEEADAINYSTKMLATEIKTTKQSI